MINHNNMIKNSFKEKLLFREQTINYALAEDLSMPESTELTDDEYNEMLKKAKNLVKSIRNPLGYIDFIIKFD